jgi:hypothetical protein
MEVAKERAYLGPAAVPQHMLALQTCERAEDYLLQTLEVLERENVQQWFETRVLVADGYDPRKRYGSLLSGWHVEQSTTRLRFPKTLRRLLSVASEVKPARLTWIEDDVVFARGGLEYVARAILPSGAFYNAWFTLYDADDAQFREVPYWALRPMREYARTQAQTITGQTLQQIIEDSRIHTQWCGEMSFGAFWPDATCAIHYPNLVQHIGTRSAHQSKDIEYVSRTAVDDCRRFL